MLAGKKIILGVCGSISAYKAPILVRLLRAAGADVRVVVTPSATQFVSPVTLATLSGYEVACKWIRPNSDLWFNHVEWGLWADLILIAPASASSISRFVQGDAPFFLDGVYLSARCPIAIAPAMDHDMWIHPATQSNIETLLQRGNIIIQPDEGALASGLVGKGRLPEPEFLLEWTTQFFNAHKLRGLNILITSGPTREPLDPVRFLSNHSTGTMGKELAYAAARQGANVFFVSGPVEQYPEHQKIQVIPVETALEMKTEVDKRKDGVNWFICAAAVADFRPAFFSKEKIKKQAEREDTTLELIKNPDILASIGRDKKSGQLVVGFALETDAAHDNALAKLERKNADIICLNLYSSDRSTGFGNKTNAFTVYSRNANNVCFGMADKKLLAAELISFFFDYAKAFK
jgi:phosphopantothenoylcysteine decarboxylase / phosphopantothenate---cysteine ligase